MEAASIDTGRSKPRRRDRRSTEAAFVTAAAAIFAERGFENATTKAIAERAGYSEGLIQNYFNGKEGLLLAVMAREMGDGDAEDDFFNRPLCPTIRDEAAETMRHFVASLAMRSTRLRIVLSRVFIDPNFKAAYGRLTYRRVFETKLLARLRRYAEAGLLGAHHDIGALSEMMICLSFELGFTHPDVLDTPPAKVEQLIPAFAAIIGQAYPGPGKRQP
jgi:TetR/AcrR family transcriptional regulator, regulator of cefoperazone and chloramphenicol sensitivity